MMDLALLLRKLTIWGELFPGEARSGAMRSPWRMALCLEGTSDCWTVLALVPIMHALFEQRDTWKQSQTQHFLTCYEWKQPDFIFLKDKNPKQVLPMSILNSILIKKNMKQTVLARIDIISQTCHSRVLYFSANISVTLHPLHPQHHDRIRSCCAQAESLQSSGRESGLLQ